MTMKRFPLTNRLLWTLCFRNGYNEPVHMMNIQLNKTKFVVLLIIAVCLITPATACADALASTPIQPVNPRPPSPISSQSPAALTLQQPVSSPDSTAISGSENISPTQPARCVEIVLIHYRGTLTRIGCCNPMLYERDEFVVIQNRGGTPQDINDWSLTNITRGYPTFRFPSHFPCLPYNVPAENGETVSGGTYKVIQNPAQSVINSLSQSSPTTKPVNQPAGEMNWASCSPVGPPDQTPMKPARGMQGIPVPCILYPGQTILVFTDEVHCPSGGFSFNWGQGNIWNNEIPDTAVLYNSQGKEVSRRSYTVGR